MQVTSDSSVLGDFDNAHFAKQGVTSSFSKKGKQARGLIKIKDFT
jgi:hypothetical protein